jgi:F0F1-type ATP synthase delta subunit
MLPRARQVVDEVVAAGQPHLLRKILDAVNRIVAVETVVADVVVQSAVPLSPEQKKKIEAAVPKYLPQGKSEAEFVYSTAPSIAGGIIVTIDNSVIDLTAATLFTEASHEGRVETVRA